MKGWATLGGYRSFASWTTTGFTLHLRNRAPILVASPTLIRDRHVLFSTRSTVSVCRPWQPWERGVFY